MRGSTPRRCASGVQVAASQGWHDRCRVNWLRASALLIARRAIDYDIQRSDAAWASWLCDGPCKSLGRHHRLSRVASGWIPSPVADAELPDDPTDNEYGDDTVSQRELDCATVVGAACPMSLQDEVDSEAGKWGHEWACDARPPSVRWLVDWAAHAPLPALVDAAFRDAAYIFPAGTGLGWDKMHPRAVCRCADGAIRALIRLLVMAELLGMWPSTVGVLLICLLPKTDGGRRPIGLLPSVIR